MYRILTTKNTEEYFKKKQPFTFLKVLFKNIVNSIKITNQKSLKLLYSDYKNNFGDILSLEILQYYYNKAPVEECHNNFKCDTVFIGSHLELFLENRKQKIKKMLEEL